MDFDSYQSYNEKNLLIIMINNNCKIKKIINPFPYIVIDNFFSDQFYIELEKYFPKSEEFQINNVGRMHGDTTYGDILYNQFQHQHITHYTIPCHTFFVCFLSFYVFYLFYNCY